MVYDLLVPADLRWVEGHFPEQPILAAVVQVGEALRLVRECWPDMATFRRIKRGKFRRPIFPPDEIRLSLTRRDGASLVSFEYTRDGEACSGGTLEFD